MASIQKNDSYEDYYGVARLLIKVQKEKSKDKQNQTALLLLLSVLSQNIIFHVLVNFKSGHFVSLALEP